MNDLRTALSKFIVWVLPVYTLVLAIVGPPGGPLKWVVIGVALASMAVILSYHSVVEFVRSARAGRRALREAIAELPDLKKSLSGLAQDLTVARQASQESLDESEASLRDSVNELAEYVRASAAIASYSAQWSLGARALFIDRMARPVYFIHSHRPEEAPHNRQEQLDVPRFTVAPLPIDEAEFVPMASQWVMNSHNWVSAAELQGRDEVRVLCGCTIEDKDPILSRDLLLIGSTMYNTATRRVQEAALSRAWLQFAFDIVQSGTPGDSGRLRRTPRIAGVAGSPMAGKSFEPDSDNEAKRGERLRDYGLLTRMPNPIGPAGPDGPRFVVIVAGCLLAGQIALTEWLSRPGALHSLSVEHEDRACQYVVSVEYTCTSPWEPAVDKLSVRVEDHVALATPWTGGHP